MTYRFLRLDIQPPVATISLDRAPGNRLSIDMMEEINNALLTIRRNPSVSVMVLRGADKVFSRGIDLRDHTRERIQRLMQVYARIFETIRMMDVIAVAAVEGEALGGGFELCLGCNLVVASEEATFALPETEQGIIPAIASIVLPRVVPRRRAMEWILTGNTIDVQQLYADGLVNRVFPADQFEEGLNEFVGALAAKSAPVLQLAKRAQSEAYYSTYEEALYKVQNIYLRELIELEDVQEGVRANLEGRVAKWQHR